jgi:hypothetical protein
MTIVYCIYTHILFINITAIYKYVGPLRKNPDYASGAVSAHGAPPPAMLHH